MKRNFRYFIGMLAIAIPLCANAQDNLQQQVDNLESKVDRMPKISGFVQGMYQANLDENWNFKEGENVNTFRMRRVRLSVEGKLSKKVSYKIQGVIID